jgi:hypothetical protein
MSKKTTYGLSINKTGKKKLAAPELPYRPGKPKSYQPKIGLIGCGGITQSHLAAYKKAGYQVVALCECRGPTQGILSESRDLL